jgi:hypothetical protein
LLSPLYAAVMLRDDPPPLPPPPPPELPPPHPAKAAAAITKKAAQAYAYCRRRAASLTASAKLSIASTAASVITITNGVWRGCGFAKNPGGSADSVVVNCAVQSAPTDVDPLKSEPVGAQVTAGPRAVLPFLNCTVPVGPADELLEEFTVAVSVMLPPDATLDTFGVTITVVAACVMVTESVLLLVFEL